MSILRFLGIETSSTKKARQPVRRRLRFESLEQRRLLTVVAETNLLVGDQFADPGHEPVDIRGLDENDEFRNGGGGELQGDRSAPDYVAPLTETERETLEGREGRSQQILRDLDKAERDAIRAQAIADGLDEAVEVIKEELATVEGRVHAIGVEIERIDGLVTTLNEDIARSHENQRRITNEQLAEHNQILVSSPDGSVGVTHQSISDELDRVTGRREAAKAELESLATRRAALVAEKQGLEAGEKTIQERLAAAESRAHNPLIAPGPYWSYVYRLRAQARRMAGREFFAPPVAGPAVGDTRAVVAPIGTYRLLFAHDNDSVLPWVTTFIDEVEITSIGRAWQGHEVTRVATYTYRGKGVWELSRIQFVSRPDPDATGKFSSGDEAAREVLADQQEINRLIKESRENTPRYLPQGGVE